MLMVTITKTKIMVILIIVMTMLYMYLDAMPMICRDSHRMKSRIAALSSSGETLEEEASLDPDGLTIAAIKGRVNWKTPVATECSCLLNNEIGMGSCERRWSTRFSAIMLLLLLKSRMDTVRLGSALCKAGGLEWRVDW